MGAHGVVGTVDAGTVAHSGCRWPVTRIPIDVIEVAGFMVLLGSS